MYFCHTRKKKSFEHKIQAPQVTNMFKNIQMFIKVQKIIFVKNICNNKKIKYEPQLITARRLLLHSSVYSTNVYIAMHTNQNCCQKQLYFVFQHNSAATVAQSV